MWKVKNIFGEEKIWYSEEEYEKLKQALEEILDAIAKIIARKGGASNEERFILDKVHEVLKND